tara:strand:- start:829 stop:3201 length:2373 start_codon:yes stop_codon:yes gene_type:complete
MNTKIIKIFFFFSFLFLSACGGGGGGGGSGSSGAAAGYAVPSCSDTGTDYQNSEYSGMHSTAGLSMICASSAYARGATGDGIKIGIIDSGQALYDSGNSYHTEFQANNSGTAASDGNKIVVLEGSDVVNDDDVPADTINCDYHGTHVAGIAAAEKGTNTTMHGVAYEAKIYPFKVFPSSGTCSATFANIGTAIDLARTNSLDIVNLSLGDSGTIGTTCDSASSCETQLGSAVYGAMEAAGSAGNILVFAAGNDANSSPSVIAGAAIYDTDFKETTVIVVAVGEDGKIADTGNGWSSDGSNKCGVASAICIAAPGTNINAPYAFATNTHIKYDGTSMAAPMVSGGLALIMQEFSSLNSAQVVDRLFSTALDTDEYSQSSIYGHGLMNLNAATAPAGKLQTINGSNLLDDPNTSYYDLVDNSFTSSAAFANAINRALEGKVMEVYDSFDRANFKVKVNDFFSSSSYVSQNTIENHMSRLMQKNKQKKLKHRNLYGNFIYEVDQNTIQSTLFQSAGDFLALGYNQTTNSFENAVDPLSSFFNDNPFGNKYLVNPYFYTGSGEDYFMSFNGNDTYGFDTFTNGNTSDLGLAFNFNPLSSTYDDKKYAGDLQLVLGTNYEQNKFLNATSSGVFSTGDMSNTNFTGLKYKKNITDDFTFVGSGFAGYTYIDKAKNSYISDSTPLLTSSFTLGLAKSNFIKENQTLGLFINQPQRVEKGNINLKVPTSSDRDRTVTYSDLLVDLEPEARQINYDLVFNKSITDMSNLSANFTHVQNSDHASNSENQNFISIFYKKTF